MRPDHHPSTSTQKRSRRSGQKHRLIAALCALALMPLAGGHAANAAEVNKLQSVEVQMGTNGQIEGINGTVLAVGANATSAEKVKYSPTQAAADLPVRIRTSYRTDKGTGSNLEDLAGYNGKVTIDVTVENLTVAPKEITYDVGGVAYRANALVGVPLTIVGSTTLKADPATVITAGDNPKSVTNGVLSRNGEGQAVVQWATVLAPPRLGTSAQLRLVMQAQNFEVPTFNVAVQRGYVTDPSSKAVLDQALNSGPASEAAMTAATIDVINEVNTNLASAEEILVKVRDDLTNSSKTLGATTVRDLASSSDSLSKTMEGTRDSLQRLSEALGTSLRNRESQTTSMLHDNVNTLLAAFGDATAPPAPGAVTVNGSGCAADISQSQGGSASIYGSMLNLNSYLQAYANANDECRQALSGHILNAIGPAEPNAENCKDTPSTTCQLAGLKAGVLVLGEKLRTDSEKALADLQPEFIEQARSTSTHISSLANDIDAELKGAQSGEDGPESGQSGALSFDNAFQRIDDAKGDIDAFNSRVTQIHDSAQSSLKANETARSQAQAASEQICRAADGLESGEMLAELEKARAYFSAERCTPADAPEDTPEGEAGALPLPEGYTSRLPEVLDTQAGTLEIIVAQTNPETDNSLAKKVSSVNSKLDELRKDLDGLKNGANNRNQNGDEDGDEKKIDLGLIRSKVEELKKEATSLDQQMSDLEAKHVEANKKVQGIVDSASALENGVGPLFDAQIRNITATTAAASSQVDQFMGTASTKVREQGMRAAGATEQILAQQQQQISSLGKNPVSEPTRGAADSIVASTSSAAQDIEGARSLLNADMAKLMIDLGSPDGNGKGFLGSVNTSAALSNNATFQLALAEQRNTGYVNLRSTDASHLIFEQAQVRASLQVLSDARPFRMDPKSDRVTTVYTFTIGAPKR
ncbi:MAG: hypothetical protein Q4C87_12225 [Actinomycetaceae bacterium]|nr:hypothetical protein [Actinomycetaceae bacterium]